MISHKWAQRTSEMSCSTRVNLSRFAEDFQGNSGHSQDMRKWIWKTTVFSEKLLDVLKIFCTSGNILVTTPPWDEVLATSLIIHLLKTGEGLLHACISSYSSTNHNSSQLFSGNSRDHTSFMSLIRRLYMSFHSLRAGYIISLSRDFVTLTWYALDQ
jgi:hypothetical protein